MPTRDPRRATSETEHERTVAALTDLADHYPTGYLDDVREGWEA